MTETTNILANGAGFSAPAAPGGFNAGSLWDGDYDFTACGVNAVGTIPMPNQAKIERFQRDMARLFIELEVAEREERKARAVLDNAEGEPEDATNGRSVDEMMEDVEKALTLKVEVFDKFRDALAKVCSNKPTRKQLEGVPEYILMPFIGHVGGLLNPEV